MSPESKRRVNIYRRALRGERLTLLFGFEMKPAPQKLVDDAALDPPLDIMHIILEAPPRRGEAEEEASDDARFEATQASRAK